MANRVQLVRGDTAFNAALVGLEGEITVDTTLDELMVHTGAGAGTGKRIPNKDTNDTLYQTLSAVLTAVAALSSTDGILVKTGASTLALRTITGTSNQISVSNGGGAAGAPTLSLASAITAPGSLATTTTLASGTTLTAGTSLSVGTTAAFTGVATFTAQDVHNGGMDVNDALHIDEVYETVVDTASAPSATTNFDVKSGSIQRYTSNAANNWTLNVRGDGSTTLDSLMAVGQSLSIEFVAINGATPYYQTALTIDGNSVTPKWANGTAPSAGNASAHDVYRLQIVKTASATFTVYESQTKYS